MTYEIVSEFMGTKSKVVSVEKFYQEISLKSMPAVLHLDPLNEDSEDIKITLDTGNGEV